MRTGGWPSPPVERFFLCLFLIERVVFPKLARLNERTSEIHAGRVESAEVTPIKPD